MANENIGVYEPGADISGRAKTAVTGKRFLAIVGNRDGGNISVGHATAAGRTCGVSDRDTAAGDLVGIKRGKDRVTFVTASGPIAAFAEVEVGAAGVAVTKTSGVAVGYAVTAAASGADAEISLY
ncbi:MULTISPECIES: capsid cement protein [Rhodococcus]|jgi:hypothetical protein|uniref:capsid cement protein n=1 Tax=Rhodococcus TaxID=1827 RepID=UPI00210EFA48|nr:capsid cement protein [Rhodococcus qingshengii]MCQ4148590.1 DUF2190 family protein [Rhodococcus qingshengii]